VLLPPPRSTCPIRILAWRAHTRATAADAAVRCLHMWRPLMACRRRRERHSCFSCPSAAPSPSASSRGARTRAPQQPPLPSVVGTCGDDWCLAAAIVKGTARTLLRRHGQGANGTGRGGRAKRLARRGRCAVADRRAGSCDVRTYGANHGQEQVVRAVRSWMLWRALAWRDERGQES